MASSNALNAGAETAMRCTAGFSRAYAAILKNLQYEKNVTFEMKSFRVNRRQTRLISGLLEQVRYRTVANKFS